MDQILHPGTMNVQQGRESDDEPSDVHSDDLDHIILDMPDDRELGLRLLDQITGISDPQFYEQLKTLLKMSLLGAVCGLVGVGVIFWVKSDSFANFLDWIESIGLWGPVIMTILTAVWALPWMLGYAPLAVIVGLLFGWWGLAILTIGNAIGYPACFFMVRYCARDWFIAQTQSMKYIRAGIYAVNTNPLKFTFILRLAPIAPGAVNSLLAISTLDWFTFLWASVLGHVPKDIMFIMFGHYTAHTIADVVQGKLQLDPANIAILVSQGVAMIAAIGLLAYFGKKSLDEMEAEMDQKGKDSRKIK